MLSNNLPDEKTMQINPEGLMKKNAWWYSLRIFITGFAAFAGIVLTKRQLSPQYFLDFNLVMNAATLLNAFLIAWFGQSIVRFYHVYHYFFRFKTTVVVVLLNFVLLGLPAYLVWQWYMGISSGIAGPLAFMLANAVFTALLSLFQAAHHARVVTVAETWRAAVLIGVLFSPLVTGLSVGADYFWIGWIASCIIPSFYLFIKRSYLRTIVNDAVGLQLETNLKQGNINIVRRLVKFGMPLSGWVFISFLFLNADKWFVYKSGISPLVAADYVAIGDLMTRGIGFLFMPISSSAYPIVSSMFDKGQLSGVKKIILKVIGWQLLLALAAAIGFVILRNLVFSLMQLHTEPKYMVITGLVLLALNAIWQISAMLHKVAELKVKTLQLLKFLSIATCVVYVLYYWLVMPVDLLHVVGVMAAGYLLYFLFTIYIFFSFRWEAVHE